MSDFTKVYRCNKCGYEVANTVGGLKYLEEEHDEECGQVGTSGLVPGYVEIQANELASLKKDAERYRYLRDDYRYRGHRKHCLEWYLPRLYEKPMPNLAEQLDRAIDEMIERKKIST